MEVYRGYDTNDEIMTEMMINGDNLIRYCIEHRCASVPIERIKAEPRIEVKRVRYAQWIEMEYHPVGDRMYCDCRCSNCNFNVTREKGKFPKYCEDCGTKMDCQH
jgi:hypothetical protein